MADARCPSPDARAEPRSLARPRSALVRSGRGLDGHARRSGPPPWRCCSSCSVPGASSPCSSSARGAITAWAASRPETPRTRRPHIRTGRATGAVDAAGRPLVHGRDRRSQRVPDPRRHRAAAAVPDPAGNCDLHRGRRRRGAVPPHRRPRRRHREAGQGTRGVPACAAGTDDERSWADPASPTTSAGRYLCRVVDGRAEMWWSADAAGVIGHASRVDDDLAALFSWWRARTEHP